MDDQCFQWPGMDDTLKNINVRTVTEICKTLPGYNTTIRKRNDLYKFIASQEPTAQREAHDRFQRILASPTKETCKPTWMVKRRQEDEETNLRNVRARLEDINNSLTIYGTNKP
jgi:hypothetical protein